MGHRAAWIGLLLSVVGCPGEGKDTETGVETGETASVDADGDGFAADADCDDADPTVNPEAVEVCDGVDNDCDQDIDDADPDVLAENAWYRDQDGDGAGDPQTARLACDAPTGTVATGDDCDDTRADIHPSASEVCDSVDNDCDALVDDLDDSLDLSTADTCFPDADEHGHGDPAGTPIDACTPPAQSSALADDCDDTRAWVFPGASETCDGLDTDCDPTTGESGRVALDNGATILDITAAFTGTAQAPATYVLQDPGAIRICDGTYFTHLVLEADTEILGVDGADATVLDAQDIASVVHIAADSIAVTLTGLTLQGGAGSTDALLGYIAGGGVLCDTSSSVALTDVTIADNQATLGGAALLTDCDAELTDVRVLDNRAQIVGGITVFGGTVTLTDSLVDGNESATDVGGVYVGSYRRNGAVSLIDTVVSNNIAAGNAGGAAVEGAATLTCDGDTTLDAGFFSNSATSGAGMYIADGTFVAIDCDFGSDADGDNNSPDDLNISQVDYEDDATLTCTTAGCN